MFTFVNFLMGVFWTGVILAMFGAVANIGYLLIFGASLCMFGAGIALTLKFVYMALMSLKDWIWRK